MQDKSSDPGLYRKLQEPFASSAEAQAAFKAFLDEAYELRVKHRIADVQLTVSASTLTETGDESALIVIAHYGDAERAEQMCAWALGFEHAEREERIGSMLLPVGRKAKR